MLTPTLAGAGVLALLAGTAPAQTLAQTRYRAIDLGTGFNSTPTGITNGGLISGNYQSAGQYRAFLWREGGMQDLGTLGGMTQVAAVNEEGVMAGLSVNAQNQQRAVRIDSADGIVDLGGAPGATSSAAHDVNAAGWIVGGSVVPSGSSSAYRALLWRGGGMTDLGALAPGGQAEARAVSDAGHVVGWATNADSRQRAFRWTQAGGMVDLGSLWSIGWSFGLDVNVHGTVVGASLSQNGQRAFVWTPANGMQDLGVPAGFVESWAAAINSGGQVVGYSTRIGEDDCETIFEPTLWAGGEAVTLNAHIEGATLHSVLDINDLGQIVGITTGGSAVLLVPVTGGNCTADFNSDGDVGTDQDIEAFFACLGGSCCPACGTADFNNDGDVGTDQDIESFFRVLGGGSC